MKYLKRFNESVQNVKELELNDDMMFQTSMILNLIPNPYDKNIDKLGALIKTSLDEEVFLKLDNIFYIRDYKDVFSFFF